MYSGNFVVAVICNGQVSTETKDGVVALPFGSEYTIRLRNKHARRAVAKVFIDDESVTEDGIVVPANNFVDLERFVGKAVRFKFVSADSGEAIEFGKNNRTDGSNGVVRVEWRLERERLSFVPTSPLYGRSFTKSGASGQSCNASGGEKMSARRKLSEGCTVEGGYSNQNFTTVHIDLEDAAPVIIQLILKGYEVPKQERVVVVGYCENCGQKAHRKTSKFCSKCGHKLNREESCVS